jgi:hypothetical protein
MWIIGADVLAHLLRGNVDPHAVAILGCGVLRSSRYHHLLVTPGAAHKPSDKHQRSVLSLDGIDAPVMGGPTTRRPPRMDSGYIGASSDLGQPRGDHRPERCPSVREVEVRGIQPEMPGPGVKGWPSPLLPSAPRLSQDIARMRGSEPVPSASQPQGWVCSCR